MSHTKTVASIVLTLCLCLPAMAGFSGPDVAEGADAAPASAAPVSEAAKAVEAATAPFILTGPPSRSQGLGRADAQRPLGLPSVSKPQAVRAADGEQSWVGQWVWQIGALATVIGLIVLIGAVVRRLAPASGLLGAMGPRGKAPSGVLEVLGRYPVARGSMLVLLKLDRRILLVNQHAVRGGTAMSTLTEITDSDEVASIIAKAGHTQPQGRVFDRELARAGGDREPVRAAVAPRSAPVARKPAAAAAVSADGADVARSLRSRLAAMQGVATAPGAAPVTVREFAA